MVAFFPHWVCLSHWWDGLLNVVTKFTPVHLLELINFLHHRQMVTLPWLSYCGLQMECSTKINCIKEKTNLNYISSFTSYHIVNTLQLCYKKTNHITLYRQIITVCSEIDTTHRNTLCGHSAEFLHVETCWYMQ